MTSNRPPRHLTSQQLHELRARLAAATVAWDLLDAPWYRALDSDIDQPHPVHSRVDELLSAHPTLWRQRREARDLAREFQEVLPEEAQRLWLEIDRLRNELALVECIASYDLGVADGRESALVEQELADGGIDISAIEPGALYLLAHVLADIARRLPLAEPEAA